MRAFGVSEGRPIGVGVTSMLPEKPGHGLRFCKLPNCANELHGGEPTRGIWANICAPCRRGETPSGLLYREQRGLGQGGVSGQQLPSPGRPAAPLGEQSIEAKAKAIVPLARKLEVKVRASKAARGEAARSVEEFSKALSELRDAAQALIAS